MPNHVLNELIFRNLSPEKEAAIISDVINSDGNVDFEILVPPPLNMWWGSVGSKHEQAFRNTKMDWARENWGTKWNAYACREVNMASGSVTIAFETAWSPPYPWLAALFNKHKISFDHNWLDEGRSNSVCGKFIADEIHKLCGDPWVESDASDEEYRRMYHLHFGAYPDENEE